MISQVQVNVSKETYAFGQLLCHFVKTSVELVKKGVSFETLPAEISAVITDLMPALQKVQALGPEEKENPKAFAVAIELCVDDLVEALLK